MIKAYVTRTQNNVTHFQTTPIFTTSLYEKMIKEQTNNYKEICIYNGYSRVIGEEQSSLYLYREDLEYRDKIDNIKILHNLKDIEELTKVNPNINLFGSNDFLYLFKDYIDIYYIKTIGIYCYGKELDYFYNLPTYYEKVYKDTEQLSIRNSISPTIKYTLDIDKVEVRTEVYQNVYSKTI